MKETKEKKNSTYSFDTHLIFHACFVHLFCCLSHNLRNCGWLCVTLHRRILDNLSQLTVDQDFFFSSFLFQYFFNRRCTQIIWFCFLSFFRYLHVWITRVLCFLRDISHDISSQTSSIDQDNMLIDCGVSFVFLINRLL